jgi:tRNA (guanine6-N2)-methyltransferase
MMSTGDDTPFSPISEVTLPQAGSVTLFALTTSGLETVSACELARLPGVTVTERTYRCLRFVCAGPVGALLALRSVDDVFVQVAAWTELGRPRSALERLRLLCARLDLFPALEVCAQARAVPCAPRFSLSVSFVGKRNYTTDEMKAVLAEGIASRHRWAYEPDDRLADVHVRLFLDHEQGLVGVRLARQPLHERWYRRAHVVGALKPSVAGALALLAEVSSQTRALDPCCGSGTLVIEAALQGARVCGGDSNALAVEAARANCAAAGVAASLQHWQAQALPLAAASVDRVLCNLPWGRQSCPGEPLATFYREVCGERRRVLAPGGRMVLLTSAPEAVDVPGLTSAACLEISVYGQRPTVLVLCDTTN